MSRALETSPGVHCIQFDPIHRNLVWRYDPERSPDSAPDFRPLARQIEANLRSCPQGAQFDHHMCDSCRDQAHGANTCLYLGQLSRQGVISVFDGPACPAEEACPHLQTGTLHLDPAADTAAAVDAAQAVQQVPPSEQLAPGERAGSRARRRSVLTRLRELPLEPAAVVITLLAMITGAVLDTGSWIAFGVAYVAGGYFGLREGIRSLAKRTIDIDLLMILAAAGAAVIGAPFEGALLLFLFSLSNVLQDFAMDRTRNAIRALMNLRPARAEVERNGETETVLVEAVAVGDVFVVRPGMRIPLDGEILTGEAGMDESLLTGESRPVHKGPGEEVLAGSINTNGSLRVRTTRESGDSTIAKIIRLVESAQSQKARTERFLDTFEQYYAGFVILLTIGFAVVPMLVWGEGFDSAFYRAITVMVAASPCALIISTPASVLSAIAAGARSGVLFKGGVFVERAGTIRAIAFDKTGTLTWGKPQLTDAVILADDVDEDSLVAMAAAVEQHSEHALAQATVDAAGARGGAVGESVAFRAVAGRGVEATVSGRRIRIGAPAYFDDVEIANRSDGEPHIHRLRGEQKTVVAVAELDAAGGTGGPVEANPAAPGESAAGESGRFLGLIAFADQLRPDAPDVIRQLRALGIDRIVMLTGDNRETAEAIAAEAGVDEVYSDLTPDNKLDAIAELEARHGTVAMVGDGVNDAPSLARASLGIAMGAGGTDVALETADVVLMADDLRKVPYLMSLSRRTRRTLVFNLGLAMGLIVMMIVGIVAVDLPLPLAVIGHEGGTVLVSLNGLRLIMYRDVA